MGIFARGCRFSGARFREAELWPQATQYLEAAGFLCSK
jgi:hypothetical protein